MSIVAEFARELHEMHPRPQTRVLHSLSYPSACEKLSDIHVVIFDIYGTLFNYRKPEFTQKDSKNASLLDTLRKTIEYFGMTPFLIEMDSKNPPEKTLWDLYHGLISLKQNLLLDKEIQYPEVRITEVWYAIVLMLKRRGYTYTGKETMTDDELAACIGYYYNFFALDRGLYPGVASALQALTVKNMRLGILSNAQFYTPIDLTLFLRDQTSNTIEDMGQLFDNDLIFFSYEYSMAKPSQTLFRKLFDALYEFEVLPSQTVFVGNDLAIDIKPAKDAGMKTALFTGDSSTVFFNGLENSVVPDIAFSNWNEFVKRVSFYEK